MSARPRNGPAALCALGLALAVASHPAAARAQQPPAPPTVSAPVLVPPALKTDSGAEYPKQAIEEHVRVTVTVTLVLEIDAQGVVKKATVETPQGRGFDEEATAAALRLLFDPATRDGAPIPARIKFRYVFAPPAPRLVGRVLRIKGEKPIAGATSP